MSLPRTPAHFPRMKHRARKRIGYSPGGWIGMRPGLPTLLDDGPTLRLWDKDWNLVATARTHAERRKLVRELTDQAVAQ